MATKDEEAVLDRASWSKPIEFILSCLGYAVGLGNVWRFPYLCYRNGGGAFLFAYLIMLVLMGLPIFLLELVLGQYTGFGPDAAFARIAPLFRGLGYCTLVVIGLITVYYMVIIAWTIFYFFASFTSELGFGLCTNDFNSIGCYSALEDADCGSEKTYYNKTCTPVAQLCEKAGFVGWNKTFCYDESSSQHIHLTKVINRTFATAEYFDAYMLGKRDSTWENFGTLQWQLCLCLLLAWVIGYLCVIRGVKSAGKAVYFTALFPYVVLTAFVIQGALLEGAIDGILLYITPDWERLLEAEVWGNAASQTFYSFGIGCGSLITLSSYSDFKNNCLKDALIVSAANAFTSIYAGFAIFSMLGFLANQLDMDVSEVAQDGPGLAFVAYPEAIMRLPYPTVWAIIFFFMLFTLGLGSQFAGVEAMSTFILDRWNHLRKYQIYVVLGICSTCYILAIPMCYSGGIYIFTLLEWNTASWAILLIGFAEIVSVSWCYGCNRFLDNMAAMDMKLGWFQRKMWWVLWVIIAPATCLAVFVFQMVNLVPAEYETYVFPDWADALGILIGVTTLVPFVVMIPYVYYTGEYPNLADWFKPTKEWRGRNEIKSESQTSIAAESCLNIDNDFFNYENKLDQKESGDVLEKGRY